MKRFFNFKRIQKTASVFFALLFVLSPCCNAEIDANTRKNFVYYGGEDLCAFSGNTAPEVYGYSYFVENLETGTVVFSKNEKNIVYPTSCVKLMTAIVAAEHYKDLDTLIEIKQEALDISLGTKTNYNYPLKAGEHIPVRDMLAAMLIGGANDAANILAYAVAGSVEEFALLMNEKAKEIGALDTVYKNPTGLHHEHMVSTAYDTALISSYAYYINEITKLTSLPNYIIEPTDMCDKQRKVYNKNLLVRHTDDKDYYYQGALGLNSGSTSDGGNCIVALARKKSATYLCVVMNSPNLKDSTNCAYLDAHSLLDACFDMFEYKSVTQESSIICEVPVGLAANVDHMTLFAQDEIEVLLPKNTDMKADISYEKYLDGDYDAPIVKGDSFGDLVVMYKGSIVLGRTKLISKVNIDRNGFLAFLQSIRNFLSGRWFKAAIVSAVILTILYFAFNIWIRYMRNRRYGRR